MGKISIALPILWSMIALWITYRTLSDLPRLGAQVSLVTVMDILWLVVVFVLAISYWVMFIKGSKKNNEHDEEQKE